MITITNANNYVCISISSVQELLEWSFSPLPSQTECCNWIQAYSLLLPEIRGSPVSFLDLEKLRNLFGSEVRMSCIYCSTFNQFEWRSASKLFLEEVATAQYESRFIMETCVHSKWQARTMRCYGYKPVKKSQWCFVRACLKRNQSLGGAGRF